MSKKRGCLRLRLLRKESLPHDVVECILERLPLNTLMRFKAVSKQWNSTIGDPFFQKRQLKQRQQLGDPDVLMVSISPDDFINAGIESLTTLVLGSSSSSVKIPTSWENTLKDVLGKKICCFRELSGRLVIHDPETKSYDQVAFSAHSNIGYHVCCFQSLISIS
ncbi:hypothetical protein EUTSA_v10009459mg [Eutrema salsugineum]|uniref:F-box domain-containing protein n=1 Tax=Eutrema salsugineum TaxID=72664 RepID=V4MUD6_EUTSA|nr:hypothetical protein EUTSA_v10009459mg [Eutrema salsugineum]